LPAAFPIEMLAVFLCPKDSGTLSWSGPARQEFVVSGAGVCGRCGAVYEIREGILRLLEGQRPVDPLTRREQTARDLKADSYDAHFSERVHTVELAAILAELSSLPGKTILDLACGTGRITRHLTGLGGRVIAADISEESLRVLAGKTPPRARVALVWCDATQLRAAPGSIDLAVSTQLLEHIPSREQRAAFLEGVHAALKPGGIFLLTVYYYNSLRRLLRTHQEGFHASGIFFRRFTRSEIQKEFSPLFQVAQLRPMQIDCRILPQSLPGADWLACLLEKTLFREPVAHLLFVKASKEPQALVAR